MVSIISYTSETKRDPDREEDEPDKKATESRFLANLFMTPRILSFFSKPWWRIVFSMIVFCFLQLMTILVAPHLSYLITDGMTHRGFEKWATSSFATAVGAVGAASIAAGAVLVTLQHNRRVEANKTWWETFEWATERAIPTNKENKDQALPFGVSLSILSPLLDDDLGGRRKSKSEQKSWALRKQACESFIDLLREPYTEMHGTESTVADNVSSPLAPVPSQQPGQVPRPNSAARPGETKIGTIEPAVSSRAVLTDRDLRSVINFVDAHPDSYQARRMSETHLDQLVIKGMEKFTKLDGHASGEKNLRILTKKSEIERFLSEWAPRPPGMPDAVVLYKENPVWVSVKRLANVSPKILDHNILMEQKLAARRLADGIPTLLIHDVNNSDRLGMADDIDGFRQTSAGRGAYEDWCRIRAAIFDLLAKPDVRDDRF